jgi:hypothetical protein
VLKDSAAGVCGATDGGAVGGAVAGVIVDTTGIVGAAVAGSDVGGGVLCWVVWKLPTSAAVGAAVAGVIVDTTGIVGAAVAGSDVGGGVLCWGVWTVPPGIWKPSPSFSEAVGAAVSVGRVVGMLEGGKIAFCVGSEVDAETSEGSCVLLKILSSCLDGCAVVVGILPLVGEDDGILLLVGEDVGILSLFGEDVGILLLVGEDVVGEDDGILLLVGEDVVGEDDGILLLVGENVVGEDVGILLLVGENVVGEDVGILLLVGEDVGILLLVGEDDTLGDGLGKDVSVGDSVSVEEYVGAGVGEPVIVGWTVSNIVGGGLGIDVAGAGVAGVAIGAFVSSSPENADASSARGSLPVWLSTTKAIMHMIPMQITAPTATKHLGTPGPSRTDFGLFILGDLCIGMSPYSILLEPPIATDGSSLYDSIGFPRESREHSSSYG